MNHVRFSIANLLVLVLLLRFGFAALRESNDLWDSGILTLTLAVLLASILLTVHRTESRRAYWICLALFGWTYLHDRHLIPPTSGLLGAQKSCRRRRR